MALLIKAGETTATNKRVYFQCVDAADGLSAETSEADGQPQISTNGAAFTNTGIGTLVAIGNGRYYAVLTDGTVDTASRIIESRYKSAETAETLGTTVQVVAFNPNDVTKLGLTALALEATLTAIKGVTWSDETLEAVMAAIEATQGATFDTDTDSNEALRDRGDTAWVSGGGAIVLNAATAELTVTAGEVVGSDGSIGVTRDDDTDIQFTWTDKVITGYTFYLTVRESLTEAEDDDDSEALFQLVGVNDDDTSSFVFTTTKTQTDECDVGTRYWYDVCAIDGDGDITTVIKGRFAVTGDVTRRITVAE